MSTKETGRSENGSASRFVICTEVGQEVIAAQRDYDLLKVWVTAHGDGPTPITPQDAFAFADWLEESRAWLERKTWPSA